MARRSEADQLRVKLGAEIQTARKAAGIQNQESLGELVGTAQTTISRWERGAAEGSLTVDDIVILEDALGLNRGQLLVAAGYVPDVRTAEEAIRVDPGLADQVDREALIALYRVFLARRAD